MDAEPRRTKHGKFVTWSKILRSEVAAPPYLTTYSFTFGPSEVGIEEMMGDTWLRTRTSSRGDGRPMRFRACRRRIAH